MRCEHCEKEFEVDESKRNWQRIKFCSVRCRKDEGNKIRATKYVPQEWPQHRSCQRCGSDFLIHFGGFQKYCGDECASLVKAERSTAKFDAARKDKKCRVCGVIFTPVKYAGNQQCCTPACTKKAKHKRAYESGGDRTKIRNLYKKEFLELVPQIRDRDGNKCTQCGSTEKLHVHHRDNTGGTTEADNDPANLITLCRKCHMMHHRINLVFKDGKYSFEGGILSLLDISGTPGV